MWILTREPCGMAGLPSASLGRKSSKTPNSFFFIQFLSAFHALKSPMSDAARAAGAHSRYVMPVSSRVKPMRS